MRSVTAPRVITSARSFGKIKKRHDENKLEQMLLDGLRSGPGIRMNPKEWKKLWAEVDAQVINNKRST